MTSKARTATVDLRQAIDHYTSSLVDRLRGFNAGADVAGFLDRWVHDEDLALSLVSMAEAAREHELESIRVKLDAALAARLDTARLAAQLGAAPTLHKGPEGTELQIDVRKTAGRARTAEAPAPARTARREEAVATSPLPFLLPVHLEQLRSHSAPPLASGQLEKCDWNAAVKQGGVTWTLGTRDGLVAGSVVRAEPGANADFVRLVSFAAGQLMGLSAREAREHGAARTELSLRGRSKAAPVSGILVPTRATAGFRDLQALLDAWSHDNTTKHGAPSGLNEWDVAPGTQWSRLDEKERLRLLNETVTRAVTNLGLSRDAVGVLGIEKEILVHLTHPDVDGSGGKGRVLMAVERALRNELDEALVVTTEERRDGNKLRRLTVAKEG